MLICALGREANLQIMGKNQLFKIPILRTFLRKMGVFPVDRGHSDIGAVKRSIQALKDGFMLMVFPEGTRVRKKNRGARPKGGVAMMAIRAGAKLPCFFPADLRIHDILRLACQEGAQVFRADGLQAAARFKRSPRDMRREEAVRRGQQGVVRADRLRRDDVHTGGQQLAP